MHVISPEKRRKLNLHFHRIKKPPHEKYELIQDLSGKIVSDHFRCGLCICDKGAIFNASDNFNLNFICLTNIVANNNFLVSCIFLLLLEAFSLPLAFFQPKNSLYHFDNREFIAVKFSD